MTAQHRAAEKGAPLDMLQTEVPIGRLRVGDSVHVCPVAGIRWPATVIALERYEVGPPTVGVQYEDGTTGSWPRGRLSTPPAKATGDADV